MRIRNLIPLLALALIVGGCSLFGGKSTPQSRIDAATSGLADAINTTNNLFEAKLIDPATFHLKITPARNIASAALQGARDALVRGDADAVDQFLNAAEAAIVTMNKAGPTTQHAAVPLVMLLTLLLSELSELKTQVPVIKKLFDGDELTDDERAAGRAFLDKATARADELDAAAAKELGGVA